MVQPQSLPNFLRIPYQSGPHASAVLQDQEQNVRCDEQIVARLLCRGEDKRAPLAPIVPVLIDEQRPLAQDQALYL